MDRQHRFFYLMQRVTSCGLVPNQRLLPIIIIASSRRAMHFAYFSISDYASAAFASRRLVLLSFVASYRSEYKYQLNPNEFIRRPRKLEPNQTVGNKNSESIISSRQNAEICETLNWLLMLKFINHFTFYFPAISL